MDIYSVNEYIEDVKKTAGMSLPWNQFKDKSFVITGATGLIGSFLVDVLLEKNRTDNLNCTVYALVRNESKAQARFSAHIGDPHLVFVKYDVREQLVDGSIDKADYVLHLASNTHPVLYATDPIGTITTNIIGVQNLLDYSVKHNVTRFVFASSNEMYGENRGDVELFNEEYCGYINCNTLRAGYPESKRCGEALCQAYIAQKGLDVVIARFTRTFGPTMSMTDSKAASQFIKNGVAGENIVLKSAGTQFFSYTYVSDAVSGLLTLLLDGKCGEAYNIADESGDIMLKDLAAVIAGISGREVVFEIPDSVEAAGFSKATKARLDGSKLRALGWKPMYNIESGIERTISILKMLQS